ncbi:MAG: hypothetical protein RMJ30_07915, partial [Nitrososphaerota archaeon]|nr:hypothetical protein [Nitrososphaerota archaeon]
MVVSLRPVSSEGLIYEVKHFERFLVSNADRYKGGNHVDKSNPEALIPVYVIVGFIPVVGNIIDAAREVLDIKVWYFGFNVGLFYYDINKGDYVTKGAALKNAKRDEKLNEGLEVILLNRANDGTTLIPGSLHQFGLRILTWTEWDKIDWIAVAISLIPGLKYGKFLNKA